MAIFLGVCGPVSGWAAEADSVLERADKNFENLIQDAADEAEKRQRKLEQGYGVELDKLARSAQSAGKLAELLKVKEAQKLLKEGGLDQLQVESDSGRLSEVQQVVKERLAGIGADRKGAQRKTAVDYAKYLERLKAKLTQRGALDVAILAEKRRLEVIDRFDLEEADFAVAVKGAGTQSGAVLGAKPVAGHDWMSPSTGMRFVWIKSLKLWCGKYEVTNEEFKRFKRGHDSSVGMDVSSLNGKRKPAVSVSLDEMAEMAVWMNERDRFVTDGSRRFEYSLPTQTEWVALAQCGEGRAFPWGNHWPAEGDHEGNLAGRSVDYLPQDARFPHFKDKHIYTCDVEESVSNPWGLFGMSGNVAEMTLFEEGSKEFGGYYGGGWSYGGDKIRFRLVCRIKYKEPWSVYRPVEKQDGRMAAHGFRLILRQVR